MPVAGGREAFLCRGYRESICFTLPAHLSWGRFEFCVVVQKKDPRIYVPEVFFWIESGDPFNRRPALEP